MEIFAAVMIIDHHGPELANKLKILGAELHIVTATTGCENYQVARLERLEQLRRDTGAYLTSQYDNPDAVDAYAEAAGIAVEALGHVDWLVSPTGSGANATGLARHIGRRQGEPVKLAAVDTPGSVLFGQADAARPFRGLGNSLIPGNLDHGLVDEVHWLRVAPAQRGANTLYRNQALDVGPTSGAAYLAALDLARRNPHAHVVFVSADTGERYRTSFLDPEWLRERGLDAGADVEAPVPVDSPRQATGPWSVLAWERRALRQPAALEVRR